MPRGGDRQLGALAVVPWLDGEGGHRAVLRVGLRGQVSHCGAGQPAICSSEERQSTVVGTRRPGVVRSFPAPLLSTRLSRIPCSARGPDRHLIGALSGLATVDQFFAWNTTLGRADPAVREGECDDDGR
jgi:hypothetical protein